MQQQGYPAAAKAKRLRKDATGQLTERKGSKGTTYGLRFKLPDGRRVYEVLGRSWEGCDRREAEVRTGRLLAQVRLGQYRSKAEVEQERAEREAAKGTVPTFEPYAAEWLAGRIVLGGTRGTGISPSGEDDLRWRLAHLNGWFGPMRLDEITEQEVEKFATAKRAAAVGNGGLSATSTNKMLSTLEAILRVAVRHRILERNAVDGFRVPGAKFKAAHLETAGQITALLDAAGELDRQRHGREGHGRALLAVLTLGGLRIGEALALRWADVNLASGVMRVRDGKTANASRRVDLVPLLREELTLLKARRGGEPNALVFGTSTGKQDTRGNVRKRVLVAAIQKANVVLEANVMEDPIPVNLRLHDARHTYASGMFAAGHDPAYVMGQIGHGSAAFTLAVYAKPIKPAAREKLAVLYGGGTEEAPVPALVPDPA
jgi:integrase